MIAAGAFGTIIAANLALAFAAVSTFPGVEVRNGYIASQTFDAEREAQQRLGWRAEAAYEDGALSLRLLDRDGAPILMDDLAARVGRPTGRARDVAELLRPTADGYELAMNLDHGLWRVDILANARGEKFRQHLTIQVTQ